ncbi:Heparinase II/III-like [Phaffia rhodozyma]|uniref:Heparinase II/III-like n=1 Tax=Phaffia rhodozyma TaxID=264483 RepID=A0A0F7SH99_PHARH|nr:Heparinase II/III-like [Phaffia rhodozyma]
MAYRAQPQFDESVQNLAGPYNSSSGGYHSGDYGYTQPGASSGYAAPAKKKRSKWLTVFTPILIVAIIVGAIVAGVVVSKNNKKASTANDTSSGSSGSSASGTASKTTTGKSTATKSGTATVQGLARIATATDSFYLPVYPSTTNTALYVSPTTSAVASRTWPSDTASVSTSSPRSHPRLIAPQYKWDGLATLIANDEYLAGWNETIFGNATANYESASITYQEDGGLTGSGVLDVARELKVRVKNWAYAYRMTNDTKWLDRTWTELNVAMGNNADIPFGNGTARWNAAHFLDLAEFTSAFAVAYDWMYDGWTDDQKTTIRTAIVENGLDYCVNAFGSESYSWWTSVNGNWNCVCNAGCTMGALAILGDDTTGQAQAVLDKTITNAQSNCANAVYPDGTWTEGPNYWYFGTTGFAEMASALTTAYGSDQGLLSANENFYLTGTYHMYVQGMTSLFNYNDHGPNKYSANANSLLFMGSAYKLPRLTLYQREQYDASEPFGVFYYDPTATGAWWDGLPYDRHFTNGVDDWASMRNSWTDNNGIYVGMKAGNMTGHQTHGDIDAGDFVFDAMGVRWAGDLGSGNYLSTGYFSSEAEDSQRWLYYRKRTEGQNTIVLDYLNQNVATLPTTTFGTTNDTQGSSTVATLDSNSAAYFTMDLTTAYNGTSIERGVRLLNDRKQMLIQDEINAPGATNIQWRMHTNATVSISSDGLTATLTLQGKTCEVKIVSPSTGATFSPMDPTRFSSDPPLPAQLTFDGVLEEGDQPNTGVTVLAVSLPGGEYSLQVLFNPQWDGSSASDFVTPSNVTLENWSTTSHN